MSSFITENDLKSYETYSTNVTAVDYNDDAKMLKLIHEIGSEYPESLTEEVKPSKEIELLRRLQRLRRSDNSAGVSNMEYMSSYKKKEDNIGDFKKMMLAEKKKEEMEYLKENGLK